MLSHNLGLPGITFIQFKIRPITPFLPLENQKAKTLGIRRPEFWSKRSCVIITSVRADYKNEDFSNQPSPEVPSTTALWHHCLHPEPSYQGLPHRQKASSQLLLLPSSWHSILHRNVIPSVSLWMAYRAGPYPTLILPWHHLLPKHSSHPDLWGPPTFLALSSPSPLPHSHLLLLILVSVQMSPPQTAECGL